MKNITSGMPSRLKYLTNHYLERVVDDWSFLLIGQDEIKLTGVFVMLEAVAAMPPRSLDSRDDVIVRAERWEHAGIRPKHSGENDDDFDNSKEPLPHRKDVKGTSNREESSIDHSVEYPISQPLPVPLSQALKEAFHLVLLGEPGSGKTTTMQFIGLCFAQSDWALEKLDLPERRVPIRIELQNYSGLLSTQALGLQQALEDEVSRRLQNVDQTEVSTLVHYWRDSNSLVLLLDGLDEVKAEQRSAVSKHIADFAVSEPGQKCRLVVASRPAGYVRLHRGFKEFTLKPFENIEEVNSYLRGWLTSLHARDGWTNEQTIEKAANLQDHMKSHPALRRILDNPLLLRLVAETYKPDMLLANNRSEIYELWVEEAWQRAVQRGALRQDRQIVFRTLESAAWLLAMPDSHKTAAMQSLAIHQELANINWNPEKGLQLSDENELLRTQLGLLARVGGQLIFAHLTFQEYFVARYLTRAWLNNREGCWAFLQPRLHIAEWREPLFLLAGLLDAKDAEDLIRRVFQAGSSYEKLLYRDFVLALQLVGEIRFWPAATWALLLGETHRLLLSRRSDIDLKKDVIQALTGLPPKEIFPILVRTLKNYDLTVVAAQTLEEIGTPEAANALRERFLDLSVFRIRPNYQAVAIALVRIGTPNQLSGLIQRLMYAGEDVQQALIESTNEMAAPLAPEFLRLLQVEDPDWQVTKATVQALGKIGASSVPGLLSLLKDERHWVRSAALEALGRTGAKEAVTSLIQLLPNPDKPEPNRKGEGKLLKKGRAVESPPARSRRK